MSVITGERIKGVFRQFFTWEDDTDLLRADDLAVGQWINLPFNDATAGAVIGEYVVYRVPFKARLLSAHLTGLAITGSDTNNGIYTLTKRSAGVANVVQATLTTNAAFGNLVAFQPGDFTLSTVVGAIELAAGDTISFAKAVTGTGAAFSQSTATTANAVAQLSIRLQKVYQ